MFASLSRFRRQMAVLTAVALVASVLAVVPAAADMHPEPDYTATFDACVGVPGSGFADVPSGHANAGDIDCIAYYGITKGTSATTYSPLMSVTREHMALFLTRLAGLVGIEVTSSPDDPGFMDTADLSMESQAAIAQLADLGITKGTSDTTYSPADAVTRGQMALFIARLMDLIDPMTDGTNEYGSTPSDVADNDMDADIGSPFTDLGTATKSAYDAITNLYELGVATGISETAYAPSASITRASMAGFMAAVLDHSNARPAGLTIQASPASGFGGLSPTVVVSVRDDSFMPVVDQAVDTFNGTDALDEDGACRTTGANAPMDDCTWNDNDEFTDEDGNIIDEEMVAADSTHVFYAWIGKEDGDEFDSDDVDYVSASVTAMNAEMSMKITTSISDMATDNQVDLDQVSSVTVTVQLVDGEEDNAGNGSGDPVARSGVDITVGVNLGEGAVINTSAAVLTTDEDGKVMYTVSGPEDDDDKNDDQTDDTTLEDRLDVITFTYKDGGSGLTGNNATNSVTIRWSEKDSVTSTASSSAPAYVIPDKDGDISITGSITLYDQYGNGYRMSNPQTVSIVFANQGKDVPVNLNRNGVGTRRHTIEDADTGTAVAVTFTTNVTGVMADDQAIQVVTQADDDDVGSKTVLAIMEDDNEFLTEGSNSGSADIVYGYDSDDTFVNSIDMHEDEGELLSLEDFEKLLGANLDEIMSKAMIDVVVYDSEGSSIFKVTGAAS